MSYQGDESAGLQPIEGYEITYGAFVWRITGSIKRRYIGGLRFDPEPTVRGPLKSGAELSADEVEITLRTSHEVVQAFLVAEKIQPFRVVVFRGHLNGTSDYAIVFRGDITQCDRGLIFSTFTVQNLRHYVETEIPSYTFQSTCNHLVYGARCGINEADFTVTTVLGDSGPYWGLERRIACAEISAKPDQWYTGGIMRWTDPDGYVWRRQITSSRVEGFFNILNPDIPGFGPPTGLTVDLVAGDDRHFSTCFNKFANTRNFGGMPYMRTRDPKRGII